MQKELDNLYLSYIKSSRKRTININVSKEVFITVSISINNYVNRDMNMIISKIVNRITNKQYMSLIITIEQSWLFTYKRK